MITQLIILVFVMLAAVLLGLAEIFFLPGLTLAGIGGVLFATGGLYWAYSMGMLVGNITLIVSAIVFVIGFVWLMRSRSLNKLALHTDVDSRLESSRDLGIKDGDEGIALSRLAPIGKAQFGNITVEAKSETEFIDEKTPVVIVRVEGYNVIVRRKEEIIDYVNLMLEIPADYLKIYDLVDYFVVLFFNHIIK